MTNPEEIIIPEVLSCRTKGFENALRRWMKENRKANASAIVRKGLLMALAPYAGKRDEIFQVAQKNFPQSNGVKPAKQEKE